MATADSEIPSKGSVAQMINRLSRPDLATKTYSVKAPLPKPILPTTTEMPNSTIHVVTFAYSASQPDEIDLNIGDVIEFLEEVEDGWARGKNKSNGKSGLYPTNFVEEKKVTASIPPKPSTANVSTALKRISSVYAGDDPLPQAIQRTPSINNGNNNKKEETAEIAKVMFTYDAQHDDELSLPKVGAIVKILKKDCGDPGWFLGELNGRKGVFPDNFVEVIKVSSTSSPPLSKPGDKPPAKPPIGFNVPSATIQAPPTVPAKPPKNVLNNSTNSTGNSPLLPTSKPLSTSVSNGVVSDLKLKLKQKGLHARLPGEVPLLLNKPTVHAETKTEATGSVVRTSSDNFEQSDEVTQLVHLNKSRPRNPARRPMSMMALKGEKSEEDLLDGYSAMSRSTVFSAAGVNKTDLTLSPSRETTFPAAPVAAPIHPISITPHREEITISKEEKQPIVKEEPKVAIVPPKSLSNSLHSLSGLSTSQQSLSSSHAPVVVTSSLGQQTHSTNPFIPSTSPSPAHLIGSSIKPATHPTMSGDVVEKEERIMVPRHEWESVLKRLDVLERRLAAVEKK